MMTPADSNALLRDYVESGSEGAFAELVHRHLNLVYSAALRRCAGDTGLAEEITQAVFTDFARKARTLSHGVVVAGWLYRHASFVSATFVRSENRRRQREQTAMELHSLQSDADWSHVAPVLEDAMQELPHPDRDALVLRFLDQQPLARVGVALGVSEDAARMRVERALLKLRDLLARRGVTSTATALGLALAQQGIVAAPASLAATVSAGALATAASTTSSTLGILKLMASTKAKLAFGTLIAAALVVPIGVQHQHAQRLSDENKNLQRALAAAQTPIVPPMAASGSTDELNRLRAEHSELLRLRGEVGRLRRQAQGEGSDPTANATKPAAAGEGDSYALKLVETWSDRGLATPEAALVTQMWAESRGMKERFFQCIALPNGADPAMLDEWHKHFVASEWHLEKTKGIRVVAVNPITEDIVEVQQQTESKDGKKTIGLKVFQRFGSEWKALVQTMRLDNNQQLTQFVPPQMIDKRGNYNPYPLDFSAEK